MNTIDVFALGLVVVALILGWRSGAIPQVVGLVGAVLGIALVIELIVLFRDSIDSLQAGQRAIVGLMALFLGLAAGEGIGSGLGATIRRRIGRGFFDTADRAAGALLGAAQGLLLVWLLGGLLSVSSAPSLNAEAARSTTLKTLGRFLPPPGLISEDLRTIFATSGLPDLFIGLEPPPAPPLPGPGQARANQIAAAAEKSTVEVAADACGYTLTGTGFAVARGYVVTNAHVIAGEHTVVVRINATSYDAEPVLFDPEMDVAVLYAPDLQVPALTFAAATPHRGTEAAALGHPGGASLTVIAAVVSGTYTAEGRDLYGTQTVAREIVELRADVQRGDSGGPLVLADGSVGGIVFAASRTTQNVGYALSATEVQPEVSRVLGSTSPVSSGNCIQ